MAYGSMSNFIPEETTALLDLKTQEWLESIPPDLQLRHPRLGLASRAQPRVVHRLRALLYLRGNHTRILIYRHHLLSPTRIKANPQSAYLVVEIAKDSIQVLVHLNATSDIYSRQQSAFNYFLIAALAVIFLAVCHDPKSFAESCRKSFHAAVKLVRDFSRRSQASRRLWNTIRGLLPRLRKLGMQGSEESREGSDQNAVQGEAGTEEGMDTYDPDQQQQQQQRGELDAAYITQAPMANGHVSTVHMDMMEGDMDPSSSFSGNTPNMYQISNDLVALFDVFEQGQQFPPETFGESWFTDGDGGEIVRRFQDLI